MEKNNKSAFGILDDVIDDISENMKNKNEKNSCEHSG